MKEYLLRQGFSRVVTLRPVDCGIETQEQTLYLCLWSYLPAELPEPGTAAIHPYYPASQKAYQTARQAAAEGTARGLSTCGRIRLSRLKPIFAHLHGFSQGYRIRFRMWRAWGAGFMCRCFLCRRRRTFMMSSRGKRRLTRCIAALADAVWRRVPRAQSRRRALCVPDACATG